MPPRRPRRPANLRGARSRADISYRGDRPGHNVVPRPGDWSDVQIPASTVPESMRIVETSPFPSDNPNYESTFDAENKVWRTVVFPALKPASRRDVELLQQWLGTALTDLAAARRAEAERRAEQATLEQAETAPGEEEEDDDAAALRDELRVLTLAFEELVRQVSLHCVERGRLLQQVWTRFSSLFDGVMHEMEGTIGVYERKMAVLQRTTKEHQEALAVALQTHKLEKQELIEKATRRTQLKVGRLKEREAELLGKLSGYELLKGDVRRWLPNFDRYRKSSLRELLADGAAATTAEEDGDDELQEEREEEQAPLLADDALIADVQQLAAIVGASGQAEVVATEIRRRAQLDERVRADLARATRVAEAHSRALERRVAALEQQAEADRAAARERLQQAQQQLAHVDGKLAAAAWAPRVAPLPFAGLDALCAGHAAPRPHQLLQPHVAERRALRLLLRKVDHDRQQGLRGGGGAGSLHKAPASLSEFVFDSFIAAHSHHAQATAALSMLVHSVRAAARSSEPVQHFGRACRVLSPPLSDDQEAAYMRVMGYLGPYVASELSELRGAARLPRCTVPARVAQSSLRNVLGPGGVLAELLSPEGFDGLVDHVADVAEGDEAGERVVGVFEVLGVVLQAVDDDAVKEDARLRALFRAGDAGGAGLTFGALQVTLAPLRLSLPADAVSQMFRDGLALAAPATAIPLDAFLALVRRHRVRTSALALPAHTDATLLAATEKRWAAELATVELVLAELASSSSGSGSGHAHHVQEALTARTAHVKRLLASAAPPLVCWLAVDILQHEADAASEGGLKIKRLLDLAALHRFERFATTALRAWRGWARAARLSRESGSGSGEAGGAGES